MLVGLKRAVELSGLHPKHSRTADKGIIKAQIRHCAQSADLEPFIPHKKGEKQRE